MACKAITVACFELLKSQKVSAHKGAALGQIIVCHTACPRCSVGGEVKCTAKTSAALVPHIEFVGPLAVREFQTLSVAAQVGVSVDAAARTKWATPKSFSMGWSWGEYHGYI